MIADDDHEDDGGAARAFADLRAELTVMRSAVEELPTVIRSMEPPDYAPSFGAVIKGLAEVGARLADIEDHPALNLTPEQHGRAMQRAGADVLGGAAKALHDEADAVRRERQHLAAIVGEAWTQEAQRKWILWAAGAGLAIGFVLFPLLGAFAPGGSYLAAWAAGHADRWRAGADLMESADPAGSAALARASRLVNANAKALQACAEAARKAGKGQRCAITVPAPER